MEPTYGSGNVPPVDFTDEDVQEAALGRSEAVMRRKLLINLPVDLTEAEIDAASQGQSEKILSKKREEQR